MNLKQRLYVLPKFALQVTLGQGLNQGIRFYWDYYKVSAMIRKTIQPVIAAYHTDNPGIGFRKYLDVDSWALESMRRVYQLKLNTAPPTRILDLGTGAGYFPFICRYYGHSAEALDVPDNEMYNKIIAALGIKRYEQYIRTGEPLKVDGRYDLITAFMICFNNHKSPDLWHVNEWSSFVEYLRKNHLNENGKLFFSFNSETEYEHMHPELVNFFKSKGARVKEHEVNLPATA